jgi:hypothetical protein
MEAKWKAGVIVAMAALAVAGVLDALLNLPVISGVVPA